MARVAMSNPATRKLSGNGLSTPARTAFPSNEKRTPIDSRQLGDSLQRESTGQCTTVGMRSEVLRWRVVHADPSNAAAAAPKGSVHPQPDAAPPPFLTTSPSHLSGMPACHSLPSVHLMAVVEGSQCAAAARIHRTAHEPKCVERSWAVAVAVL